MTATTADVRIAAPRRHVDRRWLVVATLVVWVVAWKLFYGKANLANGGPQVLENWFVSLRNWVDSHRNTNPVFLYFFNYIALWIGGLFNALQTLLTNLGWTGVTGIVTAIALLVSTWRVAVLTFVGFILFGVLGLWQQSMDTFALTLAATLLSLLFGISIGVWAGVSDRVLKIVTPVLDFMQILPTFAYLPIITLCFLIGPASGAIATMIYAIPPAVRLTAAGIREVPAATVEASTSLGTTVVQRLRQVQIPMAKRAIVVGVNQTIMAALSMVTIAALVAAPGLGASVLTALEKLDVGAGFDGGIAIVIMAIVFDRMTTAASRRAELAGRSGRAANPRARWATYGAGAALVVAGIVLPGAAPSLATFPTSWIHPTRPAINTVSNYAQQHWFGVTSWISNEASQWVIDPVQTLLTNSPFVVVLLALALVAYLVAGLRPMIVTVCALVGVTLVGLWPDAMGTLTAVIIGSAVALLLGVVFGVWIGRNAMADRVLRPVLDALQVMPAFVYLIPALALFNPSRFVGILAGVAYGAPVAIKIVAEGIRAVPESSVEAATSAGSNTWQLVTKVQLPMARSFLMIALNQGIIYVLAVVVIGGLVGSEGLGLDVIDGLAQSTDFGKGLCAGLSLVLLGIMLDRVTQAAGRGRRRTAGH